MIKSTSYTLLESKLNYFPAPELMSQVSGVSKLTAATRRVSSTDEGSPERLSVEAST